MNDQAKAVSEKPLPEPMRRWMILFIPSNSTMSDLIFDTEQEADEFILDHYFVDSYKTVEVEIRPVEVTPTQPRSEEAEKRMKDMFEQWWKEWSFADEPTAEMVYSVFKKSHDNARKKFKANENEIEDLKLKLAAATESFQSVYKSLPEAPLPTGNVIEHEKEDPCLTQMKVDQAYWKPKVSALEARCEELENQYRGASQDLEYYIKECDELEAKLEVATKALKTIFMIARTGGTKDVAGEALQQLRSNKEEK